jgi:hypothetical protein
MGLAFAAGLLALARPATLICTILAIPLAQTDSVVYALPLPALLLCTNILPDRRLPRGALAAVLVLLPALALLPLIKGSFLVEAVLSVGLLGALLWQTAHRRLALALPALTCLCLILWWRAAGQPLAGLFNYFYNELSVIAGYNDAMAVRGPRTDMVVVLLCAVSLLAMLAWGGRRLPRAVLWPAGGGVALLLFLSFKAGFVRQDLGHEAVTISTVGLMFLVLSNWLRRWLAGLAALIGLVLVAWPVTPLDPVSVASAIFRGAAAEMRGSLRLATDPSGMQAEFARETPHAPTLPWHPAGTADIYCCWQLSLFDSGLSWAPRPVMQGYAAYTPWLAQLNLDHLLGSAAPDNIFFRPETIDGRLPSLDDGPSWPALLSLYEPAGYDAAENLAWLRHANGHAALATPGSPLMEADPRLGETVPLPVTAQPLWARINVRPTIRGRVASLLLRAPFLDLRMDFADGSKKSFRIIPGMARGGFLLSPAVTSTLEFLQLRHLPGDAPAPLPKPVAISLATRKHNDKWAWQKHYHLSIAPIAFPPISRMWSVQDAVVARRATLPAADDALTACYIDDVDGFALPQGPLVARSAIGITGWAVFDGHAQLQPDAIDLAFAAVDGSIYSVPTTPQTRTDVAPNYHLRVSDHVGFMTEADLSSLAPGSYEVFALPRHGGAVRACRTPLVVIVAPR